MVTVYMTQKACERVFLPLDLSEVVNLYEVSDAGIKAFETNFECQEILVVCKPMCERYDGTNRTLYESSECRHPDTFVFGVFLGPQATCQHRKLSSKNFAFAHDLLGLC